MRRFKEFINPSLRGDHTHKMEHKEKLNKMEKDLKEIVQEVFSKVDPNSQNIMYNCLKDIVSYKIRKYKVKWEEQ